MRTKKYSAFSCPQHFLAKSIQHCATFVALATLSISADAQSESKIFAWLVRGYDTYTGIPAGTDIVPLPHVGHDYSNDGGVLNPYYQTFFYSRQSIGATIGIMLQDDTGPYDGSKDTSALSTTINWLSSQNIKIDYVFSDFETPTYAWNTLAMVDQVRSHPDPNINNARIGQYGYFPGTTDLAAWTPDQVDRTLADSLYRQAAPNGRIGLNVANPNCYPYAYFARHTSRSVWPNGPWSPNERSALFYSPLERFSTAKRALPAGHELIPWVTDYVSWKGYDPTPDQRPTPEDNAALLQHFRLRGADGYSGLSVNDNPNVPTFYFHTYGNERDASYVYWTDMNLAWHELDDFYALPGAARILNLATNITGGIEWSAAQQGDRVHVLISNLAGSNQSVNWADYPHLPLQSPTLPTSVHRHFQYRTPYLDNDNMSAYNKDQSMDNQGARSWSGINPGNFSATTPPGTGNTSSRAVVSGAGSTSGDAWYKTRVAGFAVTDKVVYSAWLYRHSGSVTFLPVNTNGASPSTLPATSAQGPALTIDGAYFKLRKSRDAGTIYTAMNFLAGTDKWYEVQIAVDPGAGNSSGGDYGTASVWVRNVTDGQTEFTRLLFDDPGTPAAVEKFKSIALQLNTVAGRSTTNFNGWQISTSGAGNAVDNLNAGYYVPHMGESFEGYNTAATSMASVPDWLSNPGSWRVRAPYGKGNTSPLALTPAVGAYNVSGALRTENPAFQPTDVVAYQARLYTGSAATVLPVGFAPYHASVNDSGPYVGIFLNELRLRPIVPNGPVYRATNLIVAPNNWYEVRVVVDPNRDIDGTPMLDGRYGVARLYVRNVSLGENSLRLMTLDDTGTTSVEALTEVPLWLGPGKDTTTFDGWYVYGYNETSQIDDLSAFVVQ